MIPAGGVSPEVAAVLARAERAASADRFEEAERELTESLKLHPGNVPAWHRRGRLRLLRAEFAGAAEDLAQAARLDPSLAHHAAQAAVLAGLPVKTKDAYWSGVLAAREGRLKAAARWFGKASQPRAAWLSWVCRARRGAKAGPERLRLVGLGYRKLEHMTVEGVRALEGCGAFAAVCNVIDDDVMDLLACYPGRVTPVLFRGSEEQARAAAATVAALPGKSALVTRGHPLVFGRLAENVLERVGDCRVYAAVSGFEVLAAQAGRAGSGPLQVVGAFDAAALDASRPAVVYFPGERDVLRRVAAELERKYATAWLMPNAGPREFDPIKLPSSKLAEEAAEQLPCAVFFS